MSMKLMVLGLLMECNRHPYDMRQAIQDRHWNSAFKLRDGSLYYAVDQLKEKGWIDAAEVVHVPGDQRPDKTIYRITDEGRAAFLDLVYAQLKQEAYPQHPMMMAMPFLRHADQSKIADIARCQLQACEARIAKLEESLLERGERMPFSSRQMLKGMIHYGNAEREWLSETIAAAEAGAFAQVRGEDGKWRSAGNPE